MSHPFGDLLSQYLHRRHGLSQSKLAAGIMQQPAIITYMCKGERLTGPQARERVLDIIGWLAAHTALQSTAEADLLLLAAGMAPLRLDHPTETVLIQKLGSTVRIHQPSSLVTEASRRPMPVVPEIPLIGRQVEFQSLLTAWRMAVSGQAHMVCVAGEAGIGKTRLAEELISNVAQQGHAVARTRAYAVEGRLAYAPVADWLRSPPLANSMHSLDVVWRSEVARLVPELLIDDPDLPKLQVLGERWQLKRMFEALLQIFRMIAQHQPLLLVLDDVQWCDAETLDWLHYLLSAAPELKLLVVATVRDTELSDLHPLHKFFRHLIHDGRLTQLSLHPLNRDEIGHLCASMAKRSLDMEQVSQLYADSGGNPLFAVEDLQFMQNASPVDAMTATSVGGSGENCVVNLPPKIRAVIEGRLAGLSSRAQALAEWVAVIGHAITPVLLSQVSGLDTAGVHLGVEELWQRRILLEQQDGVYDFSHDRIREVVYARLSPIRRSTLHFSIAQSLETIFADQLNAFAGELAGHYQIANLPEQALVYYQRAATAAQQLYAHKEAIRYLTCALAITQMRPDNPIFNAAAIDLWDDLGNINLWVHGYGSEPVAQAWTQAHTLAMQAGDTSQKVRALLALATLNRNHGEWGKSRAFEEQALTLVGETKDIPLLVSLLGVYGATLYHFGELRSAMSYFQRITVLLGTDNSFPNIQTWHSLSAWNKMNMAKCLWLLGFPDQAQFIVEDLLKDVKLRGKLIDQFGIIDYAAMLYSFLRDFDSVQNLSEELAAMSRKYDFPSYGHAASIHLGLAVAHQGDIRRGIGLIRDGVESYHASGDYMFEPFYRAELADSLTLGNAHAAAICEVDAGLAFAEERGNTYWVAQLLRLKGDALQALGTADNEVEFWYQRAMARAQSQSAKSLELRAAMSLARLWQKRCKLTQAHQLLSPIYHWFTEGFNTPDLREAKLLLDASV